MDAGTIWELKRDNMVLYSRMHSVQLMQSLNVKEYVDIEDKKDALFQTRLEFICLAESLHAAMIRETGFTQMKRFFKEEHVMDDGDAKKHADKYNLGHRVFKQFDTIVENCAHAKFDIRDLTVKEMPSAYGHGAKGDSA